MPRRDGLRAKSASNLHWRVTLTAIALFAVPMLLGLLTPIAHSQTPQPSSPTPALAQPIPQQSATPAAPNLPCLSTAPCHTISFALSQARDGDAISLAGGIYTIASPIEVDKLVTIAPNGFAPGSTTTSQITTTVFSNCTLSGATASCTALSARRSSPAAASPPP